MFDAKQNRVLILLLCLPAVALIATFIIYPLVNGVYMSFTDATPLRPNTKFVGLGNYTYLFSDPVFWKVVRNTFFIIGSSMVIALVVSIALALLLNAGIRFTGLYRTLVFQIWVVPWIAVAVLWGWLFNSDYGLVNATLEQLNLVERGVDWLFAPSAAQASIIIAFAWRSTPFLMVIVLAALQGVPDEIHEAAEVDGATYFQRTFRVTLPYIRNIVLTATLLQSIRLFQEMTLPFVLTQGGPRNSTMVLSMYSYKLAFESWDFALAAAVGTVWLLLLLMFGRFYLRKFIREY